MNALVTANGRIPYEVDDVVVLDVAQPISQQQAEAVKGRVRHILPNLEVLILGPDIHLAYIGPDLGTPIYDALLAEPGA